MSMSGADTLMRRRSGSSSCRRLTFCHIMRGSENKTSQPFLADSSLCGRKGTWTRTYILCSLCLGTFTPIPTGIRNTVSKSPWIRAGSNSLVFISSLHWSCWSCQIEAGALFIYRHSPPLQSHHQALLRATDCTRETGESSCNSV